MTCLPILSNDHCCLWLVLLLASQTAVLKCVWLSFVKLVERPDELMFSFSLPSPPFSYFLWPTHCLSAFHLPNLTCSWPVVGPRRTNAPWRQWRRCWSPCRSPCPRCPHPCLTSSLLRTHSQLEQHGSSNSLAMWPEPDLISFFSFIPSSLVL